MDYEPETGRTDAPETTDVTNAPQPEPAEQKAQQADATGAQSASSAQPAPGAQNTYNAQNPYNTQPSYNAQNPYG